MIIKLNRNTGLVYLASPYSRYPHGQAAACEDVGRIAVRLVAERDLCVFSPILYFHTLAMLGGFDLHDPVWLEMDRRFFDVATVMVVAGLEGWRQSAGIAQELEWAKEAGKPRFLLDPRDLTLAPIEDAEVVGR